MTKQPTLFTLQQTNIKIPGSSNFMFLFLIFIIKKKKKSGWDFSNNKGKKGLDLKRKRPTRAPIFFKLTNTFRSNKVIQAL